MVDFDAYYTFPADQVVLVETIDEKAGTHPYAVRVTLKSGKILCVGYKTESGRDSEKRFPCNRIAAELNSADQQLLGRLYQIRDIVSRMDKRQLRIWRQLKKLLDISEEADAEDGSR